MKAVFKTDKYSNKNITFSFMGMLLLVAGLGAGIVLVTQPQLLEQSAANLTYISCPTGIAQKPSCIDSNTMSVCDKGVLTKIKCQDYQVCSGLDNVCVDNPNIPHFSVVNDFSKGPKINCESDSVCLRAHLYDNSWHCSPNSKICFQDLTQAYCSRNRSKALCINSQFTILDMNGNKILDNCSWDSRSRLCFSPD